MQWGRKYRQIRPWALAENMPPTHKTPVAIKPSWNIIYSGVGLILGPGTQTHPPDVHLDKGSVLWQGQVSQGVYDFFWIIEQRLEDHNPNLIFTASLSDSVGSVMVESLLWLPGRNPWGHPFGIGPFDLVTVGYSGFFQAGGLFNIFPRTYHEEP